LILRERHRLKVFENRVLRRIFGVKRNKIIGLRELLNFFPLPNVLDSQGGWGGQGM
jgi:hypothetical protein